MKKLSIVLAVIGVLILLTGIGYFLYGYFKSKEAGISVNSNISSTVYINGIRVGKAPYDGTRKPGDITLRLVPDGASGASFYETKLSLGSGIKTIVTRNFGDSDDTSSGQIVSFENIGGSDASFSVISVPDSAQVSLDGNIIGFAPIKVSAISPGSHQLIVSSDGYQEENISINTVPGYKLTAIIKLAKENTPQPTPNPQPRTKTFIEIQSTPTGFLRVRDNPIITASEVAQVKPGEKFPLVKEDPNSGWFEIEYISGQTGWVSNQFAKKVEEIATPSGNLH